MNLLPLRIHRLYYPVTALGFGRRLGIWTQGCPLACPGCMSRNTWDASDGVEMAVADIVDIWREVLGDGADGVTISGGEPLTQPAAVADLLSALDRERGVAGRDVDIMVYTGYDEDELDDEQRDAARLADVLVTGRFLAGSPTTLIWRGSANQIMHLRTPLGQRRYGSYVDHHPERPPVQIRPGPDGGLWIIGVPRAGMLRRWEDGLGEAGLVVTGTSWRLRRNTTGR